MLRVLLGLALASLCVDAQAQQLAPMNAVTTPLGTSGQPICNLSGQFAACPSLSVTAAGIGLGTAAAQAALDTRTATAGVSTVGIGIGTAGYSDTGILAQFTSTVAGYNQIIIQNLSAAATASTNLILSNNLGTASGFYGELGMNSSTFTGSGPFNMANMTYLDAASGPLALGTLSAYPVYFNVNNIAAVTIGTTGSVTIGNASARASQVACYGTGGNLGYCTNAPNIGGACTCTGL